MWEMSTSNGWNQSTRAWIEFVDRGDPNREALLDEHMLRLCESPAGAHALDVGCGEGRFCRKLHTLGIRAIGVDPTPGLVHEAIARGGAAYARSSAESLPFQSEVFDVVCSYLTLIDIEDFRTAIAEMARVLRPGGRMNVANLNPFATSATPTPWVKDEAGNKLFFRIDRYLEERGDLVEWSGIQIVNFHRPMSAYFEAFLRARLVLTEFIEPRPTDKAVQRFPNLADAQMIPYFHVMQWRKPTDS